MTDFLPALPPPEAFESAAANLRRCAAALAAMSRLGERPDPTRLRKELDRLDAEAAVELRALKGRLSEWLDSEASGRRRRLALELKALCAERGVAARVVSKTPLELRLAPLAVVFDVARDKATLRFARQAVAHCRADAQAVMAAHHTAVQDLEGTEWQAAELIAQLHTAWTRVGSGWVSIGDVLPELAFLRQPDVWRREPTPAHAHPYPRVQLAYDLHRLRRDRTLSHRGLRLALAPATGGSRRDKHATLWVEDAQGQGSWMHLMRFERTEVALDG